MTTETLLELAEIVLKNSIFQFNEKTLKKLRGTAIGTKFAPPYAIIFMADLQERILKDIELKPRIWWSYIDDIFFIWEHGEDSLKQSIETLKSCHPTIRFTAEWSKEEINFFDVNIRLTNRKLETDLHIKPTDTHQFLDSTSCHPYHCKKSIPYSQALRYNMICYDNKNFDQRCNDLEKWLMERTYSEKMDIRKYSKQEVNLGIAFLNERIPKLLIVNSLLASLTIQHFRLSEAYWRNFKFC